MYRTAQRLIHLLQGSVALSSVAGHLAKKYWHLAKNTAVFWALLLFLVEKNMKNICEEVCLARHYLLWNTLQGFTFAMIYPSSVSRASEHCQCWNEKTESFPDSSLLWQAQGCHSLGSFFLFLDWVSSENKSCSHMDLCFWSQKYQLSRLFCGKHHWTLIPVWLLILIAFTSSVSIPSSSHQM